MISQNSEELHGQHSLWGLVTIGGFTDKFIMPLNFWSLQDYKQQWVAGIERIKTHDISCLVATVQDLKTRPFIVLWALYKEGDTIVVRNQFVNRVTAHLLKLPEKFTHFNAQTCYDFIHHPRALHDDDGKPITEWRVDICQI